MNLRNAQFLLENPLSKDDDNLMFWDKELPKKQITLISSQGGSGKSFLAMYELLKIGNQYNSDNTPVSSVYASAEDSILTIQDRLKMLSYHQKVTKETLNFNSLNIVAYDDIDVKSQAKGDDISYSMQSIKEFENNSKYNDTISVISDMLDKQKVSKENIKKPIKNIQTQHTSHKVITSVYMQEVIKECIKKDANILLLDSLNIIAPDGVETDNEKASHFLQHLKQQFFNNPEMPRLKHIIIIHHATKDADSKTPRSFVRGSGALYDNSRLVFIIENLKNKLSGNVESQAKPIIQDTLLNEVLKTFQVNIFVNIKAIKCNYSNNNDTKPLQYLASFYRYQTYDKNGDVYHDADAIKIVTGDYINNLTQLLTSLKTTLKNIIVNIPINTELSIDKYSQDYEHINKILKNNSTKQDDSMTIDSYVYKQNPRYTDDFKRVLKAIYTMGLLTYINQRLKGFCTNNNMQELSIEWNNLNGYNTDEKKQPIKILTNKGIIDYIENDTQDLENDKKRNLMSGYHCDYDQDNNTYIVTNKELIKESANPDVISDENLNNPVLAKIIKKCDIT